ncbi:uncharacterized protein Nmag_3483 [Natrialba magadii ATCC 43099]|uniref:DUF7988 domain-containing protein n=1 Tax=Natrialba magadii (strain ATCC 43099 / DSM 3394 / CCM 3739 / CIP 104546 / IAM 13178 / JCM 8861 / NBRC 102185 / NCIMB 2190 / MS3) TaxID=547559 RepID=D3STG6_NATMM|nr:hypothetical protein [Natrialba magadii]ADD07033.1 uncharacterized protein Nmag_3483 [Natrialba magadii ATCC 43099]ELY28824.1 hypothetical protein C500_12800 [Natrialba magadii ATCC 43099]
MSHPVRAARRHLREEHADTIAAIDDCATRVTRDWDTARTTSPDTLVDSLRSELESAGVLETLPTVLASAVDATGYELQAQPVAAPPYVVLTSCGPILRATIAPGRLVIRFDVFEVVRTDDPNQQPEYHRLDGVRMQIGLEN